MSEPRPTHHDPLDLYRLAVQHPLAEVGFIERCWAHYHGEDAEPQLLREDFAGTCAVAAAWCASSPDRQAMAVELDRPTALWAAERFNDPDLHIVNDDVMAVDEPAVDVTLALNFSVLIYHDRASLLEYFSLACRSLSPGGLLILDLFGGSDVAKPSQQKRHIEPDEGGVEPFDYVWEQRGVDEQTGKIDCRIHFELSDGQRLADAFVYDWRLWRAEELIEVAKSAGFADASLWWAQLWARAGYQPIAGEPDAAQWVAYVICRSAI